MSMDIEDLNKSQIILLTLLVSFVTSIATGIVTVSLMEKAPKDVVRVVQRVVERTVEKVENANPIKEAPKEKIIEKTIVVKEGDLIAQAIAQSRSKILAIYDKDSGEFVSFAYPAGPDVLIGDSANIKDNGNYVVKSPTGEEMDIEKLKSSQARGLQMFKLKDNTYKLKSITLNSDTLKLGQALFTFTSPGADKVAQGIYAGSMSSYAVADLSDNSVLPGTLFFNSNGELIGISTGVSRAVDPKAFVNYSSVKAFIEAPGNNPNDNTSEESNASGDNLQNQNEDTQTDSQTQATSTSASGSSATSTASVDINTDNQNASAADALQ